MNPLLGVFFHWLGGLASGSFYVPFRGVRKWSWEVYWLVNGVFSWIIAPWVAGFFFTSNLLPVLFESICVESSAVFYGFLFGMMWGAGGLTFGLTMRYLGMSLGMAVALSYCTVFGTIIPPIFEGRFVNDILGTDSGIVVLLGLGVCVLGIIIAAIAGTSKEREMSEEAKRAAIKEFNFSKGILVATFSGIMSAGMSYGMNATQPIADISVLQGTPVIWSQLPRLCVILAGGFTTNFIWCMYLIRKNNSGGQFLAKNMTDDGKIISVNDVNSGSRLLRVPMLTNYIFCAIAGVTWYLQFFFYSLGETQMGVFNFSSWPLHMASIMIFSSLWGLMLGEWRGSSKFTKTILGVTLLTLIFSTIVIGYGTNIGKVSKERQLAELVQKVELESDILELLYSDNNSRKENDKTGDYENIKSVMKFDEHLKVVHESAGLIARYDADDWAKGKLRIIGLADDLKKVNKLLVDPKDAKVRELLTDPKKNIDKLPVKGLDEVTTTLVSKTIAELVLDISQKDLSPSDKLQKIRQLKIAVRQLIANETTKN
ncbi:MAG: L-rhamnose/proton symporter RhaT [Planctomycetaceae bacterium]|jgi:L-rhamnose-H+ transport protein|nr:L-rhamnose/proton symporter RhaT [Planctomycetaceae bacterium]